MTDIQVVIVDKEELPVIADLYNEIFRPPHNVAFFNRRFIGRHNPLMLLATLDGHPVGFATGFELKPNAFFSWLTGVHPDYRRRGIATAIHEAQAVWASEHGYHYIRMECHNAHRPILHLAIAMGFNIIGLRWDADRSDNLIVFEKSLEVP